jgi:hypothetical protein
MKSRSSGKRAIVPAAALVDRSIRLVRGQRVMLDADLATLYGVSTGQLNQAVKRNRERFPDDFAFQLTPVEFGNLKSQIVISSWGGRRQRPWDFTEHGVAMLSSVLRSEIAAKVNIEIMRAFIRLRRLMATPGEMAEQLAQLAKTVELHDEQIQAVVQVLKQLTTQPQAPREMGFHTIHRSIEK